MPFGVPAHARHLGHATLSRASLDCSGSGIIRTMSTLPQSRMTVGEFLAWAVEQPGRHELVDGFVYAMSPEGRGTQS